MTLAKADAALRQREAELAGLRAEHQALRAELTAVKQGLSTSTERAEKLHEEGQVGIFDILVQNISFKHDLMSYFCLDLLQVRSNCLSIISCILRLYFNVPYFCVRLKTVPYLTLRLITSG